MVDSRTKFLAKNTLIFTIGNLATKFISFFLIPLYTNILTLDEYGTVDLVLIIVTIAVPLLSFNIMEAVMRFNLDKDVDKNKITKIGIVFLFVSAILCFLLIPAINFISVLKMYSIHFYFYCVSSVASQIFLADLRGKELLLQYSIGSVLNTFFIALYNIIFLLFWDLGVKGYLFAYIVSNIFVSIYSIIVGKGYRAIFTPYDRKKAKEMVKYSIILIPYSFMWWIMNSSDHLMVTKMIGVDANGIYAISYKLPTLISAFVGIFNQAWGYSAIKENNSNDVEEYSNGILKFLVAITMIVGVGMLTITKTFLRIYVSPNFYGAWKYTPFLTIGFVFMTLGTFMGTSYTVNKDSRGILLSGVFGATLNIVMNFIFIPVIGIYGAAIATCISYFSVFIFRAVHTKKYISYQIFTKEFVIGIIALCASGILMYYEGNFCEFFQICILLIVLIVYRKYWFSILLNVCRKARER